MCNWEYKHSKQILFQFSFGQNNYWRVRPSKNNCNLSKFLWIEYWILMWTSEILLRIRGENKNKKCLGLYGFTAIYSKWITYRISKWTFGDRSGIKDWPGYDWLTSKSSSEWKSGKLSFTQLWQMKVSLLWDNVWNSLIESRIHFKCHFLHTSQKLEFWLALHGFLQSGIINLGIFQHVYMEHVRIRLKSTTGNKNKKLSTIFLWSLPHMKSLGSWQFDFS